MAIHAHGTQQRYRTGCRCGLCSLAWEKLHPTPVEQAQDRVPAGEARAHLEELLAGGAILADLARHIGYARTTLYNIHTGKTVATLAVIAEDILSVKPGDVPAPAPAAPRTPCVHCDRSARRRGLCFRHWREAEAGVIPMPARRLHTRTPEGRAYMASANRRRVDEYIAQIDAAIAEGVPVEVAVDRLGWGRAAAARTLYRRGRRDLASPLQRVVTAAWRAAA